MKRRSFIQVSSLAGAGAAIPAFTQARAASNRRKSPLSKLNVAVLGSGLRGQSHIGLLLDRDDCTVTAIADPDQHMVDRTLAMFEKRGVSAPKVYKDGDRDYLNLLDREDIDLVVIASPWRWHTEMSIAALERNIYVGVEVCGAFSVDECWELVHAQERSKTHLFFLENVCYRRDVMAVLNMVRQGLFGELLHLEGGYQHDLRAVKFNDGPGGGSGVKFGETAFSEAKWRTIHSVHRNGDLYPTHGIGPVAMYADINRKNRFTHLTSMASKSRGLHNYIVDHPKGGEAHPNADIEFRLGDKVTTMIRCNNGETVVLHHDTNLPRPYSLGFRVQGTKGLWMDVNRSLHIEGTSPAHRWEEAAPYLEKYDHPLWKRHADKAEGAGHGGMDWFLVNSLVEHARRNERPPIDVYDAAAWLAITPLSEASIASGSMPVTFPDFTRGRWTTTENTFAVTDDY
jgi:predicted dehydrogenase